VRRGLIAGGDPEVGALVTTSCASLLVVTITAFTLGDGIDVRGCLPFFAIGMLVPGASQILFIQAVRRAGAARATVVIGVTPLASVAIAHVFLDEHVGALTVAGTSLIVLGGVALASERARPAQFRLLGGAFALVCVAAFAVRDNLVRAVAGDTPVFQAIAASLLGAATAKFVEAKKPAFLQAFFARSPQIEGVPETVIAQLVEHLSLAGDLSDIERIAARIHALGVAGLDEVALRLHDEPHEGLRLIGEHLLPALR